MLWPIYLFPYDILLRSLPIPCFSIGLARLRTAYPHGRIFVHRFACLASFRGRWRRGRRGRSRIAEVEKREILNDSVASHERQLRIAPGAAEYEQLSAR